MQEVMLSWLSPASESGWDAFHAWPLFAQGVAAGEPSHTVTMHDAKLHTATKGEQRVTYSEG